MEHCPCPNTREIIYYKMWVQLLQIQPFGHIIHMERDQRLWLKVLGIQDKHLSFFPSMTV